MKSFQELKRMGKKNLSDYPHIRLAILGDCATQHLAMALRGYAAEVRMNLQVFDADYDQIDAQVIHGESELYSFKPEFILIQMCVEKLYEGFCKFPRSQRSQFAQETAGRIEDYWSHIAEHCGARVLQFDFVEMDDAVFGNYSARVEASFPYQLRMLNLLLIQAAARSSGVFILNLNGVQSRMGRDIFHDPKLYYSARLPLSFTALPHAAKLAIDMVLALSGQFKKCVVLDLDNTLWGGTIGDDGMAGIQIGELGTGPAFTELQLWLRELRNRGILLTVCSKNDEDTAREPFLNHPDMVLRMEDISMFVANWDDKASNIRHIQQTLNLGMDSLVFLDDNPFERNLVRSLIPEITVPELPEDPARYLGYLQSLNLFETPSYSQEDLYRTEQYQAEIGREEKKKQYQSIDDYLISLDMTAECRPFDPFHYQRIAQLTQRSNQFNLRTVRYTEDNIRRIAENEHYVTLYFQLRDRFGDYGLISVVILEKQEDTLFLDTWLMSCRVLKRSMEEFIINQIIQTAKALNFKTVVGEYLRTPKNAMVAHIYERLGFEPISDTRFKADVETFRLNRTFVKEENRNDTQ